MVALGFVALRCVDLEKSRRFYELLGLVFGEEQHGNGPRHLSTEIGGLVLELYPRSGNERGVDPATLGIKVVDPETVAARLLLAGMPITEGHVPETVRATDPDGRPVYLESSGQWDSFQHYAASRTPDATDVEHGIGARQTLCGRARDDATVFRHLWHPYAASACRECIIALARADL